MALVLPDCSNQRKGKIAAVVIGVDILCLKKNRDAQFTKMIYYSLSYSDISGESGDTLYKDQISLARIIDTIYVEPKKCTRPKIGCTIYDSLENRAGGLYAIRLLFHI